MGRDVAKKVAVDMRLYISGPIHDNPDYRAVFDAAVDDLASAGFSCVNPCEVGTIGPNSITPWAQNMRADIASMLWCDGVATLPGWQRSFGSIVEVELATKLEMPVMTVAQWTENVHG